MKLATNFFVVLCVLVLAACGDDDNGIDKAKLEGFWKGAFGGNNTVFEIKEKTFQYKSREQREGTILERLAGAPVTSTNTYAGEYRIDGNKINLHYAGDPKPHIYEITKLDDRELFIRDENLKQHEFVRITQREYNSAFRAGGPVGPVLPVMPRHEP